MRLPCRSTAAASGERRASDPGNHALVPTGAPVLGSDAGVGPLVQLKESMVNGSPYNRSELRMSVHTTMGTHVDAPGHKFQHHFESGLDVDELVLEALNGTGPALLVDVQRDTNMSI